MKVGLLGCHGFIGSHILRQLVAMGIDTVGIDRYASVPSWRMDIIPPSFPTISGDILDISIVEEHLADVDLIIFAAGTPSPASNSFDLLFDEELRIIMELLAFMAAKNKTARLIFISSGGTVYGHRPRGTLCREDDPLNPISMYGVMKLACEKTIGTYVAQHGMNSIILRLANPYGPGQNPEGHQGVIPVVLKKLMSNDEIRVWGTGDVCRDYFFIDDFYALIKTIIVDKTAVGIYNVGSGQATSLMEIIQMAARITDRKPKVKFIQARPQDIDWNALCIDKSIKRFGWRPKISLEDGIRQMHDWLCK